jgi:hypothetical protein
MAGGMQRQRLDPAWAAGEREMLESFLEYQRATVVGKLEGLTDDAARSVHIPTSPLMTPIGIVQHLGYVERAWFAMDLAGLPLSVPWRGPDSHPEDHDADLRVDPDRTVADVIAFYDAECARSREIAASLGLDAVSHSATQPATLRWVLVHMIEETARHAGHLDLLRELTDGETGE